MEKLFQIPYNEPFLITKSGKVVNENTGASLEVIRIGGIKCVMIYDIVVPIMELLILTFISEYPLKYRYVNNDPNDAVLDNLQLIIENITKISDDELLIDGNLYTRIPEYPECFISNNGTIYSIKTRMYKRHHWSHEYLDVSFGSKNNRLHRVVYSVYSKTPLSELEFVHHRDNRKYNDNFTNLEHTTPLINTRYAIADNKKCVKFSFDEVDDICHKYTSGYSVRQICNSGYGIENYRNIQSIVYRIKKGDCFHDLREKYSLGDYEIPSKYTLTEDQVREICRLLKLGRTSNSIATEIGVTPATIYMIRDHKRWKWISDEMGL